MDTNLKINKRGTIIREDRVISVNYGSIMCFMNRKCMFTCHISIQSWCGEFENDVNNFLISLISAN